MIESLEIKNFKSHRKSFMAFSPGINAIIGAPNHGKTNVIRALLWLFNNRPLSGDILFDQLDKGTVEVIGQLSTVPDSISLKKEIVTSKDGKSKEVKDACYTIGGRKPFRGLNKSVPDIIKQAFNLTELNIQEQFDQPYLVNSTGGEIAKTINRITRQETADQLELNLTKKTNSINKEIKILKENIEQQEKELSKYDGLNAVEALLAGADDCSIELENLEEEKSKLQRIITDIEFLTEDINYIEQFMEVGEIINEIDNIKTKYNENKDLLLLITDFIELNKRKDYIEPIVIDLSSTLLLIDKEVENFNDKVGIADRVELYIEIEGEYQEINDKYNEAYENYTKKLEDKMQCPLCFSTISLETLERIKEEL